MVGCIIELPGFYYELQAFHSAAVCQLVCTASPHPFTSLSGGVDFVDSKMIEPRTPKTLTINARLFLIVWEVIFYALVFLCTGATICPKNFSFYR
jgi:hypothetical protein